MYYHLEVQRLSYIFITLRYDFMQGNTGPYGQEISHLKKKKTGILLSLKLMLAIKTRCQGKNGPVKMGTSSLFHVNVGTGIDIPGR